MNTAEPVKVCILKAWDESEDPLLFRPFQACLESHHVVRGPLPVFSPQLDNCIRYFPRFRIWQSDRFERTEPERVPSPPGHHLNGHASFEDLEVLEIPCSD